MLCIAYLISFNYIKKKKFFLKVNKNQISCKINQYSYIIYLKKIITVHEAEDVDRLDTPMDFVFPQFPNHSSNLVKKKK